VRVSDSTSSFLFQTDETLSQNSLRYLSKVILPIAVHWLLQGTFKKYKRSRGARASKVAQGLKVPCNY